jgi:hypothetical protein
MMIHIQNNQKSIGNPNQPIALKISTTKKFKNQKSQNFCQMFVIFNHGFKNL